MTGVSLPLVAHAARTRTLPTPLETHRQFWKLSKSWTLNWNQKLEDFTKKNEQVLKTLSEVEVSVNYAHKEIETLKDGQTKISSDSKHLKDRVDKTQKDFKAPEKTIEQMKQGMAKKTNDLKRWTRNFSVIIHNIPNLPRYGDPEVYNKIVANILVNNKLVYVDRGASAPVWTTQNKDLQGGEEGVTAQMGIHPQRRYKLGYRGS